MRAGSSRRREGAECGYPSGPKLDELIETKRIEKAIASRLQNGRPAFGAPITRIELQILDSAVRRPPPRGSGTSRAACPMFCKTRSRTAYSLAPGGSRLAASTAPDWWADVYRITRPPPPLSSRRAIHSPNIGPDSAPAHHCRCRPPIDASVGTYLLLGTSSRPSGRRRVFAAASTPRGRNSRKCSTPVPITRTCSPPGWQADHAQDLPRL